MLVGHARLALGVESATLSILGVRCLESDRRGRGSCSRFHFPPVQACACPVFVVAGSPLKTVKAVDNAASNGGVGLLLGAY